ARLAVCSTGNQPHGCWYCCRFAAAHGKSKLTAGFSCHMRILLFGKNGQLGWELQRSLAPLGEVIALGTQDTPCPDFTRPSDVAATVRALAPDVMVKAAAYTAGDKAESDGKPAMTVNAVTPGLLAQAAAGLRCLLVHYSTDYVFDGQGVTPWREDDPVAPLNEYGRSKLAGEENI